MTFICTDCRAGAHGKCSGCDCQHRPPTSYASRVGPDVPSRFTAMLTTHPTTITSPI